MSSEKQIDELSGVETTGHEWDGIKELNNPLPRWWLWTFYATIVWALAYTIAYPAWPLISSATTGVLGYSSRADVKTELAAAEAAQARPMSKPSQAKSVSEILADDNLRQFAIAGGRCGLQGQLRPVPRLRRAGLARLSQPQRRRLALGRQARRDLPDHRPRRPVRRRRRHTHSSEMPAFGRRCSSRSRSPRSPPMSQACRARPTTPTLVRPAPRSSPTTAPPATAKTAKGNRNSARPT